MSPRQERAFASLDLSIHLLLPLMDSQWQYSRHNRLRDEEYALVWQFSRDPFFSLSEISRGTKAPDNTDPKVTGARETINLNKVADPKGAAAAALSEAEEEHIGDTDEARRKRGTEGKKGREEV